MRAAPSAMASSDVPDIGQSRRRPRARPAQPEPAPPPTPSFSDGLWTTADVAKICKVSEGTVRHWRFVRGRVERLDPDLLRRAYDSDEELGPPFAKVGRHVRYRPADVRAWLAGKWSRHHRDEQLGSGKLVSEAPGYRI